MPATKQSALAILQSLGSADIEREIQEQLAEAGRIRANISALKVLLDAALVREGKAPRAEPTNGNGHGNGQSAQELMGIVRTTATRELQHDAPTIIAPRKGGRPSNVQRVKDYLAANGPCRLDHLANKLNIPIDTVRVIAADHLQKQTDGKYQVP